MDQCLAIKLTKDQGLATELSKGHSHFLKQSKDQCLAKEPSKDHYLSIQQPMADKATIQVTDNLVIIQC